MRTITIVTVAVLTAAGICMAVQPIDVLVIDGFEADDAIQAWELRPSVGGEVVTSHATRGNKAMRVNYPAYVSGNEQWPAAITSTDATGFPPDWSGYERLLVDVFVEADTAPVLRVQVNDQQNKYMRSFTIEPGRQQTLEFDLAGVASVVDLAHLTHLHFYMTRPPRPATVYIDNIRLASYPISTEGLRFVTDPFGAGRVAVTGFLSRIGDWRLGVVSENNRTVSVDAGSGDEIDWQWDGRDEAGRPVEPGTYRIIARVSDPERPDARPAIAALGELEVRDGNDRGELLIWQEPTTKKVMLHSRPGASASVIDERALPAMKMQFPQPEPLTVEMARNEVEGTQMVLLAREQMRVRITSEQPLRHIETDQTFAGEIDLLQVGYAKTEQPPQYEVDHVGWWPDPLIPVEQIPGGEMIAERRECMPVWINVRSTKDTEPGVYRGYLTVQLNGATTRLMPLQVTVRDVSLPDSTTIRTAFTLDPNWIRRVYGDAFSDALMMKYNTLMAEHRINPDDIYRNTLPEIEMLKQFDARDQINAFCIRYFRHSEDGQGYQAQELAKLAETLDPYIERLRAAGLADRGYFYGWDERGEEYFDEITRVATFLHERYPEVPFMTTSRDHTYGLESGLDEVDIWVPLTPYYDRELADAARARGTHVWWYICIGPRHPHANWFVEYPAIEARLLWWMTYEEGADGFLYYRTTRWPNADGPMSITGGNETDWDPDSYNGANGDGCLIVAGPEGPITTVRLENIRDGIEDYELLRILADRRGDDGDFSRVLCDKVITTLTDFTHDTAHFSEVRRRLLREAEGE